MTLRTCYSIGQYLQSIMSDISQFELGSCSNDSRGAFHFIEYVYESIVYALQDSDGNVLD